MFLVNEEIKKYQSPHTLLMPFPKELNDNPSYNITLTLFPKRTTTKKPYHFN